MRNIIGPKQTEKRVGFSRSTMWREEKAGRFPQRVQISPNRVGWFEDEIDEFIESRPRIGSSREVVA
mgnify:CR=1 FL=1